MIKKKIYILAIFSLFIGASVVPISIGQVISYKNLNGNIYNSNYIDQCDYVTVDIKMTEDDPNNCVWRTIQDGIRNVTEGGTVYVYNGTYNENVVIDKTINLFGEDRGSTFIDGNLFEDVVYISASAESVVISGFTIKKAGTGNLSESRSGIKIRSRFNNISENNIGPENVFGISIEDTRDNTIYDNYISGNSGDGIRIYNSHDNTIENNYIGGNLWDGIFLTQKSSNNYIINNILDSNGHSGIHIYEGSHDNKIILKNKITSGRFGVWILKDSDYNEISNNLITDSWGSGIKIHDSEKTVITKNQIEDCMLSINLEFSPGNEITENNLMAPLLIPAAKNARIVNSPAQNNNWDENFWNDHQQEDRWRFIWGIWIGRIIPIYADADPHPHESKYDYEFT